MIELYWLLQRLLFLLFVLLVILRMDGGYLPVMQLCVVNLIAVLIDDLMDQFLLLRLEERNRDGLFLCLEQIFLDDLLILIASQFFFNEDLELLEVTKPDFFFYDLLPYQSLL